MTLMAGPVDARVNPTEVNTLAVERSIDWFESHLIAGVPARYAGARRRVYPGFVQLAAFMSMNVERHVQARTSSCTSTLPPARSRRRRRSAISTTSTSPCSTCRPSSISRRCAAVFQEAHARRAASSLARRPPVEPARDPAHGAAHGRRRARRHLRRRPDARGARPVHVDAALHEAPPPAGRGRHYGVFSGRRWESQIYPILRNHILASN